MEQQPTPYERVRACLSSVPITWYAIQRRTGISGEQLDGICARLRREGYAVLDASGYRRKPRRMQHASVDLDLTGDGRLVCITCFEPFASSRQSTGAQQCPRCRKAAVSPKAVRRRRRMRAQAEQEGMIIL